MWPNPASTTARPAVFVFDSFVEPAQAEPVQACVRCRDHRLMGEVFRQCVVGTSVAVSGELTMCVALGAVEDELCAVRVSIEADDLNFAPSETST
jgi:hypothetical protein